jgi:zinc protease
MMDLEVDRMRFLKIDPQDLKSELQVVAEERRWRIDNNPQGLMRETLFSKIFQGSPYSWPVIGFMEDIQAYSSDKLRFFYDTYYVPNNAVLVLAGDFDLTQAKRWIEKYYGALPKKEIPPRTYSRPTELRGSEKIILKKKVQSQQMMLAYSSVDAHHPDAPALEVAAYILGGGLSSRLYKKLVYEIQSVSSVSAFQLSNNASGLFAFSAALRPRFALIRCKSKFIKR